MLLVSRGSICLTFPALTDFFSRCDAFRVAFSNAGVAGWSFFESLTGLSWLQTAVSVSDVRDLVSAVQAVPNSGSIIPRIPARLVVSFPVFVLSFPSIRNYSRDLIYSGPGRRTKDRGPTLYLTHTLFAKLFLPLTPPPSSSSAPQVLLESQSPPARAEV